MYIHPIQPENECTVVRTRVHQSWTAYVANVTKSHAWTWFPELFLPQPLNGTWGMRGRCKIMPLIPEGVVVNVIWNNINKGDLNAQSSSPSKRQSSLLSIRHISTTMLINTGKAAKHFSVLRCFSISFREARNLSLEHEKSHAANDCEKPTKQSHK